LIVVRDDGRFDEDRSDITVSQRPTAAGLLADARRTGETANQACPLHLPDGLRGELRYRLMLLETLLDADDLLGAEFAADQLARAAARVADLASRHSQPAVA
jgi:hypothetical protein